MFKYSNQTDLDDLTSHLEELQQPKAQGTRTLKELKSGVFHSSQRIKDVELAIKEHKDVEAKERKAYDAKAKADRQLQAKKEAYPLSKEYVQLLERLVEIGTTAKGGGGYLVSDDIEITLSAKLAPIKLMLSKAERGLAHLEQFTKGK